PGGRGGGRNRDGVERLDQGAQPEVLRDAAVEEVHVRPFLRVLVRAELERAQPAPAKRGAAHDSRGPGGLVPAAGARPVDQRDRREHGRQRRGGGDRARHGEGGQIRAEDVEGVLREGEAGAGGHVRPIHDHERAAGLQEIPVRGMIEDRVVVQLRCEIGAGERARGQPEPIRRIEHAARDGVLDVPLEELALELLEDPVAPQRVVGGGERASRDGGDDVDRVEEGPARAAEGDFGAGELLEHAVGEGGGPGAASREREEEQEIVGLVRAPDVLKPVAAARILPGERRVLRPMRAGGKGGRGREDRPFRVHHRPHCTPMPGPIDHWCFSPERAGGYQFPVTWSRIRSSNVPETPAWMAGREQVPMKSDAGSGQSPKPPPSLTENIHPPRTRMLGWNRVVAQLAGRYSAPASAEIANFPLSEERIWLAPTNWTAAWSRSDVTKTPPVSKPLLSPTSGSRPYMAHIVNG